MESAGPFIKQFTINNFKSILHAQLQDCKQINLIIGRPNVGKSNVLEAMALAGLPTNLSHSFQKRLSAWMRLEHLPELFYNGDSQWNEIKISVNYNELVVSPSEHTAGVEGRFTQTVEVIDGDLVDDPPVFFIDETLRVKAGRARPKINYSIKPYRFDPTIVQKKTNDLALTVPFGQNLTQVIFTNNSLFGEVKKMLEEHRVDHEFDFTTNTIRIRKQSSDGKTYLMGYQSLADTLRRQIFFTTAAYSNQNSVLVFEEPEAHTYPPYLWQFSNLMLTQNTNQYFLTTHSMDLIHYLLKDGMDQLAVHVVYTDETGTRIKRVTHEELAQAYQSGIDFILNLDWFLCA